MRVKNKIRRILCYILSILMIISLCPVTAGAETVDAVEFTAIEGTRGIDNSNYYENYPNLIDGDTSTKWCVSNFSTAYIIIESSRAVPVSGYSITTGNDTKESPGRNPKDWVLYGSNDKSTWDTIHSVSDDKLLPSDNYKTVNYAFDKTETEYKYFKLEITANHTEKTGSDCMQLSEFSLEYCDHVWGTSSYEEILHDKYEIKTCTLCGVESRKIVSTSDHTYNNGICSICGAIIVKDMVESFAGAETVTLPANFDYELGSENVLYKYDSGNRTYAKLVKVEVTEQDIGKMLAVKFGGMYRYVNTYLFLFRQNGDSIEHVTETDNSSLTYKIESAGTYYIALAGYETEDTGLCHAEIKLQNTKDMTEGFKEIETATELSASFDYELGSEDVIYSSSYNGSEYTQYAKLVKVDVTEQNIGKALYIWFAGKNEDVDTYLWLFRQNGDNIEYVTRTDSESLIYKIEEAGTYYIALAGYDADCTGLCHAEIKLVEVKDLVEGFKDIEAVTELPTSFDYELGSEDVIYSSSYNGSEYTQYAKLVKVDVTEQNIGKALYIWFAGKNEDVDTYLWLFRQNGDNIEYVTRTDGETLYYSISSPGTYYIALAGYSVSCTGLCHADIKIKVNKDIIDGFKEIETATELPTGFDYELGSSDVIYSSSYDESEYTQYAKLVKVDVTEQEIGKSLYINFAGKSGYVDTYLWLFRQNGDNIEYVTKTYDESLTYKIESAGTYYIALAGYGLEDTGLCHAEIKLVDVKDLVEGFKKIEAVTELPAGIDYELGNENHIYKNSYGDWVYAKLLKINIQSNNTLLDICFEGKDEYIETYVELYKETDGVISKIGGAYGIDSEFFIPESGTYYIALEVLYGTTGLCHADINTSVIDEYISECLDFTGDTIPVPEEGALWSWNEDTLTLTLKDGFYIVSNEDGIILPDGATVIVEGKADIKSRNRGIYAHGSLVIKGTDDSLLTIYSSDDKGIYGGGDLLTEDCEIKITSYYSGIGTVGTITIRNCVFDITSCNIGLYNDVIGEGIIIENSKVNIVALNEGIHTKGADVTITDSDIVINRGNCGIYVGYNYGDCIISINGGKLVIESRYPVMAATGIELTDVKLDVKSNSSEDYFMYMNNSRNFSLPGTFCLYDIDGNELYRGEWKSELLDDYGNIAVDGVGVNRIVSVCNHDWSTEWTSDATHHWHECKLEDCDVTDNASKYGYSEHETELINAVKPSDTTEGYTGDTVCKVCGYVISHGTVIPKTGWKKNATGWWYDNGDGTYPNSTWKSIGGVWYYFNEAGYIVTGWFKDSGSWYYFDSNGKMATGWRAIEGKWYFFESNGKMAANKWVGTNYFVKSDGVMATDEWVDGGRYYVDATGKWVPNKTKAGWKQNATGWWYDNGDSTYPTSTWKSIDGSWYYFNASGYIVTGWFADGGSWYYFDSNGKMATGWKLVDGKWYYLESNGKMAANKWVNNVYYVKSNGVMATNEWVDQGRYYVGADGKWVPGKTA